MMKRHGETVSIEVVAAWNLLALYAEKRKHDRSATVGMEALVYLLADTEIGDEVAKMWIETTGMRI